MAAGGIGGVYGHRAGGRTPGPDRGQLNPDGSLRPVGESGRRLARSLREKKPSSLIWRGREIDIHANGAGLAGLWETWRPVYGKEMGRNQMEELRMTGFNRDTGNLPPSMIDRSAAQGWIDGVNACWTALRAGGEPVDLLGSGPVRLNRRGPCELKLVNTGPVAWKASRKQEEGTVWIEARHEDRKPYTLQVPATRFGDTAKIKWSPADSGTWTLRPYIEGMGGFGEALVVEVRE